MLGGILLVQPGVKVAGLIQDLLVLAVPGRQEQRHHVLLPDQRRARQEHRRPVHLHDLVPQPAQRTLSALTARQRSGRILQVHRTERLQPPPHRRPQPRRLRRHPIHQQQPRIGPGSESRARLCLLCHGCESAVSTRVDRRPASRTPCRSASRRGRTASRPAELRHNSRSPVASTGWPSRRQQPNAKARREDRSLPTLPTHASAGRHQLVPFDGLLTRSWPEQARAPLALVQVLTNNLVLTRPAHRPKTSTRRTRGTRSNRHTISKRGHGDIQATTWLRVNRLHRTKYGGGTLRCPFTCWLPAATPSRGSVTAGRHDETDER